jgi:hypothetical protein
LSLAIEGGYFPSGIKCNDRIDGVIGEIPVGQDILGIFW